MKAYQIILLVVVILALIYVAVLIYVMSHAIEFNIKLKKRSEGLYLVFALKKERILEVFSILEKEGVAISKEDNELIVAYRRFFFTKKKEKDIFAAIDMTKTMYARMSYYLSNNDIKNKTIEADLSALKDANTFYRSSVALYNSEVTGLNYWVNVPLCRWLPFLCGVRKRKIIG